VIYNHNCKYDNYRLNVIVIITIYIYVYIYNLVENPVVTGQSGLEIPEVADVIAYMYHMKINVLVYILIEIFIHLYKQ
jgi:hypothetical protein